MQSKTAKQDEKHPWSKPSDQFHGQGGSLAMKLVMILQDSELFDCCKGEWQYVANKLKKKSNVTIQYLKRQQLNTGRIWILKCIFCEPH